MNAIQGAEQNRFSFGGVKHIYDQHSDAVTTVRFAHNDDSTLVAGSADGRYGSNF